MKLIKIGKSTLISEERLPGNKDIIFLFHTTYEYKNIINNKIKDTNVNNF